MDNTIKNVVITVAFSILLGSLFVTESTLIHAGMIAITLVVTIALNLINTNKGSTELDKRRLELI
jgi:hypothetical protein